MTANAGHQIDPLARLGRQLVVAAEHRLQRRRRRRTALTVSAATLALGGAVGVAAIETDVLVTPIPMQAPGFAQHGSDRVDLTVSGSLNEPWKVAIYRSVNAGLCITAPTAGMRSPGLGCSATSVTAEELDHSPVTSTSGTIVQRAADDENDVIVTGLARTDVESVSFEASGASPATKLEGTTLSAPILDAAGHETKDLLTVRPFAVLTTAPTGATSLTLIAHTSNGDEPPYTVRVQKSQETP